VSRKLSPHCTHRSFRKTVSAWQEGHRGGPPRPARLNRKILATALAGASTYRCANPAYSGVVLRRTVFPQAGQAERKIVTVCPQPQSR
jgi:hypothetical protein